MDRRAVSSGVCMRSLRNEEGHDVSPHARLSNSGDGIQLSLGGELLIDQSSLAVSVGGNGGFDLNCVGTRAAAGGSFAGVAKISATCSGF
jgi:hypothetical protein